MRVLQLIDSLDAGGAERIAVTYANSLCTEIAGSYLCATRKEGVLKEQLEDSVTYLFLQKKSSIDLSALLRLRSFVKQHQITIIHAHTTSYFTGALLKCCYPSLQLIWHEHHGAKVATTRLQNWVLYICSFFFSKIIVVNKELLHWCREQLACKRVLYLPNFVATSFFLNTPTRRASRIVCVANLRDPKNHLVLLQAFKEVQKLHPQWSLQLVGKEYQDAYAEAVKQYIRAHHLSSSVLFSGSSAAIPGILAAAAIGVLSSDSEGLPVALLEYGAAGLAVVATDVGQCKEVVGAYGIIVPKKDPEALAEALLEYIEKEDKRQAHSRLFHKHIQQHYSEEAVVPLLLNTYTS